MAIRLIASALRDKTPQDCLGFQEIIENYGLSTKLSEGCYAVETGLAPEVIRDDLRRHMGARDQVYIMTLTGPWSAIGPQDVNEWLLEWL